MSIVEQLKSLNLQLNYCLSQDRFALKRQLDRCRQDYQKGKLAPEKLTQLTQRFQQSVTRKQNRQDNIPVLNFPDLPVTGKKDDIAELIK